MSVAPMRPNTPLEDEWLDRMRAQTKRASKGLREDVAQLNAEWRKRPRWQPTLGQLEAKLLMIEQRKAGTLPDTGYTVEVGE